jgi:hypothetical protein
MNWSPSPRKRVFLSFRAEDKNRVQGLRLLAQTPKFDFEFYDESVREAIDSRNADYIKSKIKEKISRTSVTVCLVSEDTHKSEWVNWEIEESLKKGNNVIVMALKGVDRAILPKVVAQAKLKFWNWDPDYLSKLING